MITPGMERATKFIELTEIDTSDRDLQVVQSKQFHETLLNDYIKHLSTSPETTLRVFTAEQPAKDIDNQYGKWLAWYSHIKAGGKSLEDAYFGAEPYSPLHGDAQFIEQYIKEGRLQESDKDIWEIIFKHPTHEYFYIVKYLPGEGGFGYGYRVSVSNDWASYESTARSIESGLRYDF